MWAILLFKYRRRSVLLCCTLLLALAQGLEEGRSRNEEQESRSRREEGLEEQEEQEVATPSLGGCDGLQCYNGDCVSEEEEGGR